MLNVKCVHVNILKVSPQSKLKSKDCNLLSLAYGLMDYCPFINYNNKQLMSSDDFMPLACFHQKYV